MSCGSDSKALSVQHSPNLSSEAVLARGPRSCPRCGSSRTAGSACWLHGHGLHEPHVVVLRKARSGAPPEPVLEAASGVVVDPRRWVVLRIRILPRAPPAVAQLVRGDRHRPVLDARRRSRGSARSGILARLRAQRVGQLPPRPAAAIARSVTTAVRHGASAEPHGPYRDLVPTSVPTFPKRRETPGNAWKQLTCGNQ